MLIPPYPLLWPDNVKRTTKPGSSLFKTSLAGAMKNVNESLKRFAADSGRKIEDLQITSNAGLLMDKPTDTGIAVWFRWDGEMRCIAVDRYAKIEDNLQAIHHVIEARRTEMRHAGIELTRTAFKGFQAALPAPDRKQDWRTVLKVLDPVTMDSLKKAYRDLARKHSETPYMQDVNIAYQTAIKEMGFQNA